MRPSVHTQGPSTRTAKLACRAPWALRSMGPAPQAPCGCNLHRAFGTIPSWSIHALFLTGLDYSKNFKIILRSIKVLSKKARYMRNTVYSSR
ncbi:unnamed protein product [Danaus chrysippus]|uniref:(African queen) hypothetical protein n=1 Tax=Danaus chrysippus TaxID=151541 RepID=A0A8J2R1J3_9NEOP|nr:unnamed protein product [Danaus chrysippus]